MMNLKKLAPWNWFKNEQELHPATSPIRRSGQMPDYCSITLFHHGIDRMLENFFRGFDLPSLGFTREPAPLLQREWLKPALDIRAGDKEYTISVELPGVDEKDLQLDLSDGILVIKGEKKHHKEEREKNHYKMERSYGAFHRVLSLPEDAERDGIGASYKHGILTVTIPRKAKVAMESKRIAINRG